MRLINIRTLELETFVDGQIPSYAILSHRWGKAELTFEDVSKNLLSKVLSRAPKTAYEKLKGACQVTTTLYPHLKYLWIDTCCIDKRSSSELSEAINSMYRWYQDAEVCFAFLEDVDKEKEWERAASNFAQLRNEKRDHMVRFEQSVWFTRAWTLQELLAPRKVRFFDYAWQEIGTRSSLVDSILQATNIPPDVLLQRTRPEDYSIATRMSWAARRVATRTEDIAYSLLGLFNVSMPMLYGEREHAFVRLQEEIIKRDRDRSFLLWGLNVPGAPLFATSPADFFGLDNDKFTIHKSLSEIPFALNNAGLNIQLELTWWELNTYAAKIAEAVDMDDPYGPNKMAYFILLKPSIVENFLHRAGLIMTKDPIERFAKPRTRKVTILRDPKHHSVLRKGPIEGEISCGFRVHQDSLPITHYAGPDGRKGEASTGFTEPSSGLLQYDLIPLSNDTFNAYMHCQLADDHGLFLLASFNFDFNPMVMFSKAPLTTYYWAATDTDGPTLGWEDSQGAKVKTFPQKYESSPQRWACKCINRQGIFVTLPDYLSLPGWHTVCYIDFIEEIRDGGGSTWMWQIAITRRKDPWKMASLAESFATDPFFKTEAMYLKYCNSESE